VIDLVLDVVAVLIGRIGLAAAGKRVAEPLDFLGLGIRRRGGFLAEQLVDGCVDRLFGG
jgi:hypothetical protein